MHWFISSQKYCSLYDIEWLSALEWKESQSSDWWNVLGTGHCNLERSREGISNNWRIQWTCKGRISWRNLWKTWPCSCRSYYWSGPTIPRVARPSPQLTMSPGQGRRGLSPGRVSDPEGEGGGGCHGGDSRQRISSSRSCQWTVETVKLGGKTWDSTQICTT